MEAVLCEGLTITSDCHLPLEMCSAWLHLSPMVENSRSAGLFSLLVPIISYVQVIPTHLK